MCAARLKTTTTSRFSMAKPAIKPLCEKCGGIVWGANRLWVDGELKCRRCVSGPRKYRLQGARMNDSQLLMPAKPKVRVPFAVSYAPTKENRPQRRAKRVRERLLRKRDLSLHPDVRKAS
jgi:hypothetical protein